MKAAENIRKLKSKITSGKEAQQIKGVGKSVGSIIDEYLFSGKVERLEEERNKFKDKYKVIESFKTVHGIGPKKAEELYEKGYRDIDDLNSEKSLTDAQKIGLKYYHDLVDKIPRKDIVSFDKKIKKIFNNETYEIVGSYRRKEKFSGDIDILFLNNGTNMQEIRDKLSSFILDDLALGKTKYMGILALKPNLITRIDIRLVDEDSWPSALLYFTGSKEFNIFCRNKAIEKGYVLNEYGVFKNDVKITLKSEKEILNFLGLKFFEPQERSKNFT